MGFYGFLMFCSSYKDDETGGILVILCQVPEGEEAAEEPAKAQLAAADRGEAVSGLVSWSAMRCRWQRQNKPA